MHLHKRKLRYKSTLATWVKTDNEQHGHDSGLSVIEPFMDTAGNGLDSQKWLFGPSANTKPNHFLEGCAQA